MSILIILEEVEILGNFEFAYLDLAVSVIFFNRHFARKLGLPPN